MANSQCERVPARTQSFQIPPEIAPRGLFAEYTYCPGVITGVLVYLPLSLMVVVSGVRDGLFTPRLLLAALAVAAIFHKLEVGHNVFKRW
jgi:hypothetical protein